VSRVVLFRSSFASLFETAFFSCGPVSDLICEYILEVYTV
jgi:hypothetical protein